MIKYEVFVNVIRVDIKGNFIFIFVIQWSVMVNDIIIIDIDFIISYNIMLMSFIDG